jgi:uncharacterized SAM-binding protein YcdF (DUF218 family)
MAIKSKSLSILFKTLKGVIISFGCISIIMVALSFTSAPFWGYYWLGTSECDAAIKPKYIIVMGGSAIPGKSGLMRSYYAAAAAKQFPEAKIIISLPGNPNDSSSSIRLMQNELTIRDVNPERINLETNGKNTRFQAMELKKMIPALNDPVILVTSPDHMRRAILTFKKVGFTNISGIPAFEGSVDFNLQFNDKELGGRNRFIPDIGQNTQIRYRFWIHLEYEVYILREIVALGFYNLKGWI